MICLQGILAYARSSITRLEKKLCGDPRVRSNSIHTHMCMYEHVCTLYSEEPSEERIDPDRLRKHDVREVRILYLLYELVEY